VKYSGFWAVTSVWRMFGILSCCGIGKCKLCCAESNSEKHPAAALKVALWALACMGESGAESAWR